MTPTLEAGIIRLFKNKAVTTKMTKGIAASFLGMVVMACGGCGGGGGDESASSTKLQAEVPLPVYLMLGQSNMVGMRSDIAQLPQSMSEPQKNALFFKDGAWIPLAPGVSEPKGFGPEISFAASMPGQIGLIKVAAGDTTLAVQWSPSITDGLYAKTINTLRQAQATRSIDVKGVLWMQGESDGKTAAMADAYAANLMALIQSLRRDTGNANLVVSVCRVTSPVDQFPYTPVVRAAQASIAMPGYQWFDCDSLPKGLDNLHYDTAGEVKLGELFASSIRSLGAAPN